MLIGGKTAHSAFKIPINVERQEVPTCSIKKQSAQADLFRKCCVIFWDECTMAHKKALQAVDKSLQDIRNSSEVMGGVLLVLAGDFRQTLPIISGGTAADEINACLQRSELWRNVQIQKLTTNMRAQLSNDPMAAQFAESLLTIGNGTFPQNSDGHITIPESLGVVVNSVEELINKTFPDVEMNYTNNDWLSERALLAAHNKSVDEMNTIIQKKLPGKFIYYIFSYYYLLLTISKYYFRRCC